jgi:hypothetical protein
MRKELTAQQIFDKVAKHLAKQGKKSYKEHFGCLNYGPNETRCAVACLVPRRVFRENKDLKEGGMTGIKQQLIASGVNYDLNQVLLSDLMSVHDNHKVENWPAGLIHVASTHRLKVPEWLKAVA